MKVKPVFPAAVAMLLLLAVSCQQIFNHASLSYSGTLEMTEHSVGARVAGRLVSLLVEEGDEVKKGQLIGTLDRCEQAKRDYDRVKALYNEGGTDEQSVEYAKLAMEDQQVVSPVDGVVLLKVHEAGEIVAQGGAVAVIGDRSKIWVRVYVPEGAINRVRLGQKATLRFDGLKKTCKGRVSFIAPKAEFTPRNVQTPEERVTQTFAVKVTIEDPEPFLRPGVASDVSIHLRR